MAKKKEMNLPEIDPSRLEELKKELLEKEMEKAKERAEKKLAKEREREAKRLEKEAQKAKEEEALKEKLEQYAELQAKIEALKEQQKALGIKRRGGGGGGGAPRPKSVTGKHKSVKALMEEILTSDPEIKYEDAEAQVKAEFPDSAFNKGHFSWYKRKILRD